MARDHERSHGDILHGTGELLALLERLKGVEAAVLRNAIKRIAQEVAEKARDLAPDDPEPTDKREDYVGLKESLKVRYHARKRMWVIRFATRHAAAQHERLDWPHKTGQAKYLEQPLQAAKSEYLQTLGENVEAEIAAAARRAKTKGERARRRALRDALKE